MSARWRLPGAPPRWRGLRRRSGSPSPGAGSVSRVDPASSPGSTDRSRWRQGRRGSPVGGGSVWIASALGDRVRRDATRIAARSPERRAPNGARRRRARVRRRGGCGSPIQRRDVADRVGPAPGRIRAAAATSRPHPAPRRWAAATMWVADYRGGGSLAEVDRAAGPDAGDRPRAAEAPASQSQGGAVWVANALDSTVARLDARSGSVAAVIPVASGPAGLALRGNSRVGDQPVRGGVSRIDGGGRRRRRARCAWVAAPTALAGGSRQGLGRRAAAAAAPGGTLRLRHARPINSTRPVSWTCCRWSPIASSTTGWSPYDHVAGPAGLSSCPTLRSACPHPPPGARRTPSAPAPASATPTGGHCSAQRTPPRDRAGSGLGSGPRARSRVWSAPGRARERRRGVISRRHRRRRRRANRHLPPAGAGP